MNTKAVIAHGKITPQVVIFKVDMFGKKMRKCFRTAWLAVWCSIYVWTFAIGNLQAEEKLDLDEAILDVRTRSVFCIARAVALVKNRKANPQKCESAYNKVRANQARLITQLKMDLCKPAAKLTISSYDPYLHSLEKSTEEFRQCVDEQISVNDLENPDLFIPWTQNARNSIATIISSCPLPHPKREKVIYDLGGCYLPKFAAVKKEYGYQGRLKEAAELRYLHAAEKLKELTKKNPNSDEEYYQIAKCYEEMREFSKALKAVQKSLELGGDKVSRLALKAGIYTDMGKHLLAADCLTALMHAKEQPSPAAFCSRGIQYYRAGKVDLAMKDFDQSMSLDKWGGSVDAHYFRGLCLERKRRKQEAIRDFEAVVKLLGSEDAYQDDAYYPLFMSNKKHLARLKSNRVRQ